MSDSLDDYKDIANHTKALRAKYGVKCPECVRLLPKANATILLPGQRCRIHNYTDKRQALTNEQWGAA